MKRLMLKIHRNISEPFRMCETGPRDKLAFPFLRCGMIYLEHAQPGIRIAMSKGVESGTKHDILHHSGSDGPGENVLGKPAADHKEGTQTDGVRPRFAIEYSSRRTLQLRCVWPEDPDGKWVFEHERSGVKDLVGGAAERHAQSRPRRAC